MAGSSAIRVPPGRAGVLQLRRRLSVAEAGAELLTRKLTVLSTEAERLTARAAETGRRWQDTAVPAQHSLGLAGQLAGDRGFRLAALAPEARVTTTDTSLMGLRYPAGADCFLPERSDGDASPAEAALWCADQAVRAAVRTAAVHAAAMRAAETVSREVALTRRRLRALEHRRIPALREALRLAYARVEEAEAADALLRRWAADRPPG
ncbi:V-type ATP synthase subunit D [Actinoplanes sp. KI2]|uniref:V-type ATP synthase subunit D n=1 Tax=Actinoplanes sp. KI2 TaxID=2983315 RepID=UPI0021D5D835|nr:V-type ATP synthase subunit D [Actinoplanes sp. KI2]MCU7729431.1 V-type ATP synthase subunit D [Actinoplanes sp. KI2]